MPSTFRYRAPLPAYSHDMRFKYLDREIARHGDAHTGLLEVLVYASGLFEGLSKDILAYIASSMHVPVSRVFAVTSFYHSLLEEGVGTPAVQICSGTSCFLAGSSGIESELSISSEEPVPYRRIGCRGLCNFAPMAYLHGHPITHATAESVRQALHTTSGELS